METQKFTPQPEAAQLIIVDSGKIRCWDLDSRPFWSFGREDSKGITNPDIHVASRIVSRDHGCFVKSASGWLYVDNPENTNGTFHNERKMDRPAPGLRTNVRLYNGDVLRVDKATTGHGSSDGVLMVFMTVPVRGHWSVLSMAQHSSILIGRDSSCDIVEPFPYFSRKHAKITNENGRFYITDCGSRAGSYLNKKRITGKTELQDKDCINLCSRNYFVLGTNLVYVRSDRKKEQAVLHKTNPINRPVVLRADIETKKVKNNSGSGMKELIRDIHLEIREGTLVALLGTAGAGKSTVMNCLNGMDLEGVHGSVIYRDVDLMEDFDQMKFLIGSVPQKKTFHRFFTPEREFTYAAIKRLPADTTKAEIRERVDHTLEMLSMTGVRSNRNSKLSGGEQTRVNVGIELVADRDLLCLDEPDQGLSPNYKHELFEIMRNLAHQNGKSVLTIIHDVSEIDMFDQVIMLAKVDGVGRLAFSGTPAEAKEYFGCDIRDAYALLERDPRKFVR